jgi:hypothetical protein
MAKLTSGREPAVAILAGAVFVPKFVEAQEAAQSDKQRKAEQRARARDRARAEQLVPKRDEQSQNGTDSHENGQNVTASHSESLRAVLYRTEPCGAGSRARVLSQVNGIGHDQALEMAGQHRLQAAKLAQRRQELQVSVCPTSQQRPLGETDLLRIVERLEEGYTPTDLGRALDAMAEDARKDPSKREFLFGATWSRGVIERALGRAAAREPTAPPGAPRAGDEWLTYVDLAKREARMREQGKPIPWANDPARQRMTHDKQGNRLEPCGGDA